MKDKSQNCGYMAPWESAFDRVLTSLEEFIQRQTTGAVLLMLCAVAAFVIANGPWSDDYHHMLDMRFAFGWEGFALPMSVHHWINVS